MKRLSTNGSIAQSMKCEMIIPIDPLNVNDDIDNCKTRNWGIPGEILYFYIVTSSTVLQIDALSFSVFLNKKPTTTRILPNQIDSRELDLSIELVDNITIHNFKSQNSPFRLSDGRAVYPLSIKIPITMNVPFSIDIYLLRNPEPIIVKDMFPIMPFDISLSQNSTTVSSIMKFSISAKFKYQMIQEIDLDEIDVKLDPQPHHNNQDIISNIEIRKPLSNLISCRMKNEDSISAVFSFMPLSEIGAALLTNLPIRFIISWHYANLTYSTVWQTKFVHNSLDLAILVPPARTKIMETFSLPIKISNLKDSKRKLEIIFDCGPIQPITARMRLPEIQAKSSITINMSAIGKMCGYQPLEFWIEEDKKKIKPLYPIYVYVNE